MKRETYIILIIEVLLLVISLLQMFVFKSFSYFIYLGLMFIVLIISYFLLKLDKRKERLSKDIILIISISVLLYWLVTYVVGYFTGFLYNSYQRSFLGIVKNLFNGFCLISIIEIFRHMFLRRRVVDNKVMILSVVCFSLIEIATKFSVSQLDSNVQLLKLFFSVVVPIFSKNVLLDIKGSVK